MKYFDLSDEDKRALLTELYRETGKTEEILEKDVWITQTLQVLFSKNFNEKKPMAFKGGTSLSKVFGVIDRFSEDIDITVDFNSLGQEGTKEIGKRKLSNSQRSKLDQALKDSLNVYLKSALVPYLKKELEPLGAEIEIDNSNHEKVWVSYQRACLSSSGYVKDKILLEFGGRNAITPNDVKMISCEASKYITTIEFPKAYVNTLSPLRTFWEKATLIHVACHRDQMKATSERQSRHWYDLAILGKDNIGQDALKDIPLLDEVLTIKRVFFNSGYANYNLCESGNFKLIPDDPHLKTLRQDYEEMIKAGMFLNAPPRFENILSDIQNLQDKINNCIQQYRLPIKTNLQKNKI